MNFSCWVVSGHRIFQTRCDPFIFDQDIQQLETSLPLDMHLFTSTCVLFLRHCFVPCSSFISRHCLLLRTIWLYPRDVGWCTLFSCPSGWWHDLTVTLLSSPLFHRK
ncbi:unnamed protein product [Choristocarpus tenellus]